MRRRSRPPLSGPSNSTTKPSLWRRLPLFNIAALLVFLTAGVLLFDSQIGSNLIRTEAGAIAPEGTGTGEGKHKHKTAKTEAEGQLSEKDKAKLEKKQAKQEIKEDRKEIDAYFDAQDIVPYFSFDFLPQEWDYIHKDARRFAECSMTDGMTDKTWKGVAVHLKGSAGSFQGPDAKPGLSISMNKYKGAERWHGCLKWHLNNGAQDNSFLNEQMSCEMARMAGVPASRCAHAIVKWQGRDLGLFVFKEAFDNDFLSHFFKNVKGDLYDGGFVADVRPDMEKDEGDRENRENIKELIAACQEGNLQKRWERLEKIVDIHEYISFTAIEAITCHWDGYNFNRNNYRLYFDADTGKAVFLLHGTDQTFGDANFPITRDPGAMVGQAVMSNPAWKQEYHDRVEEIYTKILKPIDWPAHVVEVGQKVKAALEKKNPQWAKDYEPRINEARDRVANRIAGIAKQLGDMPKPFRFDQNGVAKIDSEGWRQEGSAASIDAAVVDGKPCFHVRADGETTGSWRKTLTLTPGKYRLVARLRTQGVAASQSTSGEGAGLRISGGTRNGQNSAGGDTPWKEVAFQFDAPGGDVILVAELRASKGEAWFERDSFRLETVK